MEPELAGNIRDERGRFKPGVSGNPAGKPKDTISITAAIRRRLEMLGPDQKRTVLEHLADNIMQDALDGKPRERKLTWNYIDGMPQQKVEVSGDLIIEIVNFKDADKDTPSV